MLSGLFTSTLTQQAITYPLLEAVATNSNESATVDRATSFSTYDGNDLKIRMSTPTLPTYLTCLIPHGLI